MNSSSVAASARPAALRQPGELAAQDLARRRDDVGAVVPLEVGHAERGALVPADTGRSVSKSGLSTKSP